MSSGCLVSSECVLKYQELKMGSKYSGITYKLSDDFNEIVVESMTPKGTSFSQFTQDNLPLDGCRYAVYDYHYTLEDGGKRSKLVFILWTPSSTSIKSKMVTASSKESLRKKLVGIATELQAGDKSEISDAVILEKCKRK